MNNREFIEKSLGSFLDQISDNDLKQKTIKCFELAMERGKKTGDILLEMPFTLLTECKGVNFMEHTKAVTAGAIALYEAIEANYDKMPFEVNRDWLVVGGLLHDVGKCMESEPHNGSWRKSYAGKCARHPISGAILAAEVGLPQEIVNIIGCHAKEGDGRPQRIETVLIHQADFATFNPMVMMAKGLLIE